MNFRKVLSGIDVRPLLMQLRDVPTAEAVLEGYPYNPYHVMWRKETEWTYKKRGTAVYNEPNIVLRYVTLGRDDGPLYLFEDERNRDEWTRPAFSILDAAKPIVFAVAQAVSAEHIGHVIITRLSPGKIIGAHVDQAPPDIPGLPYWQRHQVPLQADDGVVFSCGGEDLHMAPGEAWWFNNQKPHSVRNDSSRDRLSMIVELRPMF